jgi:cell division protein FtsQ
VVGAVLLTGLLATGIWLVFFSAAMSVTGVTVTGTDYLAAAEVERVAEVPLGEPVARVDLDEVRARVESLPAVLSADVTRAWPDAVQITVTERTAVAVIEAGSVVHGMDRDGRLFREYVRLPSDLPVVRIGADAGTDARAEAARVIEALPAGLAVQVDYLEVESIDRIAFVLRDGRRVTWGSAEESGLKARVLEAVLTQPALEYDVSVPSSPTTSGRPPA